MIMGERERERENEIKVLCSCMPVSINESTGGSKQQVNAPGCQRRSMRAILLGIYNSAHICA